jgi:hypothetical protein
MARRARYAIFWTQAAPLGVFVALIGATASAEDYPECAKFDNPLAYNQCLAMHGPAAHGTKGMATPPEGQHKSASSSWRSLPGATAIITRTRSGKMIMEFSVNEPAKSGGARKRNLRR